MKPTTSAVLQRHLLGRLSSFDVLRNKHTERNQRAPFVKATRRFVCLRCRPACGSCCSAVTSRLLCLSAISCSSLTSARPLGTSSGACNVSTRQQCQRLHPPLGGRRGWTNQGPGNTLLGEGGGATWRVTQCIIRWDI